MAPIVIGIGGVSNGGKSLLCEKMSQKYSSVVCNMDDYYNWPDDNMQLDYLEEYNNTYANFEVASAVNFERLLLDVETKIKETEEIQKSSASNCCRIVLVEGILIFHFKPLQKYFTKKYFITLPKDVAKERRQHRVYCPPDPVNYFENYVWPYYIKHKEILNDQTDIVYLDGSLEIEANLETIYKDLDSLIASPLAKP